jgi:hypothetical protein
MNQILRRTLLLATITATMTVQAQEPSGQANGQDWRKWSFSMRISFAIGFNAGYNAAVADVAHPDRVVRTAICLSHMTYGQNVAIMDKYIADHPEKWDRVVHSLFADAITKACAAKELP